MAYTIQIDKVIKVQIWESEEDHHIDIEAGENRGILRIAEYDRGGNIVSQLVLSRDGAAKVAKGIDLFLKKTR